MIQACAGPGCKIVAVVCTLLIVSSVFVDQSAAFDLRHHFVRAVSGLRPKSPDLQSNLDPKDGQQTSHGFVGTCNQYGSRVHLCRLRDVAYQAGSIPSHWQAGTNITFLVSSSKDQNATTPNLTLPGPCAETTAPYPGCRANKIIVQEVQASRQQKLCTNATSYHDPVVLVYRNFMNTVHWLNDQVAPFFLTLQEFGLTGTPVQIIALDEERYTQWKTAPGWVRQRDADWARLGGRNVTVWGETVNTSFCAPWAILGNPGHILNTFEAELPLASVLNSTARYQGFAQWVLNRFGVNQRAQLDATNPVITIADRSASVQRRILNIDEVLQIARGFSSSAVTSKFEAISVQKQLNIAASSDVFVAVHGAALAWAAFLPPWGVVVELKPYGYGTQIRDFYHGICSWARLFRISHVSWHNRNASASIADDRLQERWYVKDFHTMIDPGNASWILGTAVNMTRQPPQERNLNECINMNEPNEELLQSSSDSSTGL